MAYWMTHLRVAEALLRCLPEGSPSPIITPVPLRRIAAAPSGMRTVHRVISLAGW